MSNRFISMVEVLDRVGLSKVQVYREIKAGRFPRQVPITARKIAFLESEIDEWMSARLAAREAREGDERRRALARQAVRNRWGRQCVS